MFLWDALDGGNLKPYNYRQLYNLTQLKINTATL